MNLRPECMSFAAMALFCATAAAWSLTQNLRILDAPTAQAEPAPIDSHVSNAMEQSALEWKEPRTQSAGDGWVFDLFTPPFIRFDSDKHVWTVTAPGQKVESPPFGLELSAIRRPLYRLQYSGYAGDTQHAVISIHNIEQDFFLVGRVGESFSDGDFSILSFEVELSRTELEGNTDATPHLEERIELRLRDHRTDSEVVLENQPLLDSIWQVILVESENPDERYIAKVGDTITTRFSRFIIQQIDPHHHTVTVTRISIDGTYETQTLFLTDPTS